MIDRAARNKAAEVLRHFISGRIINYDFEKGMQASKDPALWAIEDSVWCFYDDFEKHKLDGKWALPQEVKKEMERWIIFLHSDNEYLWPKISHPGLRRFQHGFFSRLANRPEKEKIFMATGDYSVWPFFDRKKYDQAIRGPKLLSGW